MKLRQCMAWQFAALITTIVVSILAAPQLPGRVPTHWGIDGKPDAWGSPAFALWMGPATTTLMILMTLVIPWLPRGKDVARFPETYAKMMVIISGLFTFLHVTILFATMRGTDLPSIFMIGMFLFFAGMGNLMGKVKPNPYMGIRTPWTMANEKVWEISHRRAAYIYVGGGLIGALVAAVGVPLGVQIGWMMLFSIYPVLDSYLVSKSVAKG